ncbi:ovarian cancer G-protein coupled receptor 1 [Lampris incognitus]|uniref:ovarian cancer G-protein coupled receptor 1 n=1 Tax=Lampris incognitus TaxID=2546036 RepID=UPI0024B5361E|nr:ovarian cancer G-protein coupled receptor 1 [Lampris incognitus]
MGETNTVTPTITAFTNSSWNATVPPVDHVANVISWLTFSIGLPAIGLAIYALKNLAKGQNKVPIHIISLLVSDVLSFFGRPQEMTGSLLSSDTTTLLFYFGVVSNVTFMVCIAQERHLLVAYPQCHECFGRVKQSAVISLAVWAAPFAVLALVVLRYYFWFSVVLLAPFPLLLFFAIDSSRAVLCCTGSPPTAERQRTVWGLMVVFTNYTLLYLPFALSILLESLGLQSKVRYLGLVSHLMLYLSPLVDPFLYIFLTKGPQEVWRALSCFKKRGGTEDSRSTVDTVAETVETRL